MFNIGHERRVLSLFNFFQSNTDDFQFLLDQMGQDVLLNGVNGRVLITNTNLNKKYDDKNITSTIEIKRGDLIDYNDSNWLIVSEVNGQRYSKYKGIMRKCNFLLHVQTGEQQGEIIGYDGLGRPVYGDPTPIYTDSHAIVDNIVLTNVTGEAINILEGKITVTVQDNVDTQTYAINQTFTLAGINWTIAGINKIKVGLIELECSRV